MGKLLRLELFNFKSYKGHHKMPFGPEDKYFTSIIGPNGSGKSNSMDAISFVLGIKASHLRSVHLRDLIYRGRALRKSLKKLDLGGADDVPETPSQRDGDPKTAWVMAVYIDDDEVEHHWKRTITAQGASEYRINNRVVTASQYNTALEKQRILIKARNFLVFQGDVEAIASQSPKDLTRLIEQISGSLEYKVEYDKLKQEQEVAADTATFNLNRRRGINAEIKQYQEQKKEAESYQAKMLERDEAIVTHILWKLFHFQRAIEHNKKEIERHQHEVREFRRTHEDYAKRLDDSKREHAQAARGVSKLEKQIKVQEKECRAKESSLVPIDEKINISNAHLKKYSARISEIIRDRDNQSATVKSLENELGIVKKAQVKFEKEQKKAAEESGIALSDEDLAEYNKLKERVNTQIANEQIQIGNLTRQQRTDVEALESLKSKVESAEWQVSKLQSELHDFGERKRTMESTLKQTMQEIDSKKKEYNSITSERLRNAQKHTELDEKLKGCLQSLLEADDGRRESEREIRIKETMSALKRIFPGVKGRISELCKPVMKKYSEAVSTVLGRHFDAVVVDNEKTAKDCIEYLRDQRAGQATFLPLETIQVKPLNSSLKGMHRGMRMAIDTIVFDNSVERAMLYACGNAIVCDDLQVAKYICYDKGLEVKAVTLDGTVIHKGGLMTGGRVGGRGGRRWEDQEVEALKKLRDNLVNQITSLPKNRRGAQEEALQGELTGLEERLAYHREESSRLGGTLSSKQKEVDYLQKTLRELKPQLNQATASLNSLQAKLAELEAVVSEADDQIFADFCKRLGFENIRVYEKQQGSHQQEAAQRRLEFATQMSKIENQLLFERQRLKQTVERIENLEKLASRDKELIEELEVEKNTMREETDTLAANIEMQKEKMEARQAELDRRAQKVTELKREVAKRMGDLEEANKLITQLESEIERNAAGRYAILRRCKLEEIDLPLENGSAPLDDLPIDDTLQQDPDAMDVDEDEDQGYVNGGPSAISQIVNQDYGIEVDFDNLDKNLQDDDSEKVEERLFEKIKTLAGELERMSPNMKAIERLEGVESRLQSTEKQFEDSRKAAKQAKENFETVKAKRHELFMRAFQVISENIEPVYQNLTKSSAFPEGGRASLDLEDTSEPYNDGVRYHAMPPGKRFRGMEHLSGGEKTMAALALLFAVHSFQPSPFFVLDEVDAALDNSNVQKIANYIKANSGPGVQFIVISLKTALFQQSDCLVGIYTDQVECTSKNLTIDLTQYVENN